MIGIYYAPSALLLVMCTGAFLILFQFSIVLSNRTREVKMLAQSLALLEERVRQLEAGQKTKTEDRV